MREFATEFGLRLDAIMLCTYPENPYDGCDLDDPETMKRLRKFVEAERPGLVIIDTLWRATSKRLYNEGEVNEIAGPLIEIAQSFQVAVVLLMHLSKDGETLGRRLEGLARSVLRLTEPDPGQPNRRRLECRGNHKSPHPLGITLRDGD